MSLGAGIFLLAVGAILAFAVNVEVPGIDLTVVGYILMAAGVLGLLISMMVLNRAPRDRVVTRERDVL